MDYGHKQLAVADNTSACRSAFSFQLRWFLIPTHFFCILEKETIYLTPEELAKIPKSDPFYGCTEPGCKYYIVRYPCDTEVYNTLADLCAMRVYIWAKSQRVFNVALGNGIHLKVSYGGNGDADF